MTVKITIAGFDFRCFFFIYLFSWLRFRDMVENLEPHWDVRKWIEKQGAPLPLNIVEMEPWHLTRPDQTIPFGGQLIRQMVKRHRFGQNRWRMFASSTSNIMLKLKSGSEQIIELFSNLFRWPCLHLYRSVDEAWRLNTDIMFWEIDYFQSMHSA